MIIKNIRDDKGKKITMRDYQRGATNFMKKNNRCGLFLDMGLGKAIDDETIIPTVTGEKKVKDIEVGDYLYDRLGNPTKVTNTFKHKNKKAYKVTLKDGRSFICCDEHLVPFIRGNGKIGNRPLGEMIKNYKKKYKDGIIYKYRIPQNEKVKFEKKEIEMRAYVLGVLIADETLNDISELGLIYKTANLMRTPEDTIANNPDLYDWREINNYRREKAKKELEKFNFLDNKKDDWQIPNEYIYNTIGVRMGLLQGVIDTSGQTVVSKTNTRYFKYKTKNKKILKQLEYISRSLGYGVKIEKSEIKIFTQDILVKSDKNMKIIEYSRHGNKNDVFTTIVDIEQVENRDMTCFTVDNEEKLFLINDFITTHNTLVTLTGLVELAMENKLKGHILVIAPKRIAINTWPSEIEKWSHTRNASYKVLAGLTKKKRDKILDDIKNDKPTIYIINRELVAKLVQRFPKKKWPFLNVIIDEAQSFKSPSSGRFKEIKKIAPYTHRWIELTGTPAPNGLLDIWSLVYLIDGGKRLGRNITTFKETHFLPGRRTPEGYPYEWLIINGHEKIIHKKIKDIAISMKAKDYLGMEEPIKNIIKLDMTKKERKIYNELKKEKVLELMDGDSITALNGAVLAGKLLQLSNGAIYKDDNKNEIIKLHDHKIKALEDIIEGSNGKSILCFYWFKHDLIRLKEHFGNKAEVFTGEPEQLREWNEKKIPLLLAQPASAGHGLNFQHGGHIMVFFSIPTSLELYEQSIGRLHRTGQTKTVIVHHLMMRGTVENNIINGLVNKKLTQDGIINAVKADLKELI